MLASNRKSVWFHEMAHTSRLPWLHPQSEIFVTPWHWKRAHFTPNHPSACSTWVMRWKGRLAGWWTYLWIWETRRVTAMCVSCHSLPPPPRKQMLIFDTVPSSIYVYFRCGGPSLLPAGPTLCCNAWASRCGGFSCWGAPGSRRTCSAVLVHGLSCSVARGSLWHQGSNLCPLHCKADS